MSFFPYSFRTQKCILFFDFFLVFPLISRLFFSFFRIQISIRTQKCSFVVDFFHFLSLIFCLFWDFVRIQFEFRTQKCSFFKDEKCRFFIDFSSISLPNFTFFLILLSQKKILVFQDKKIKISAKLREKLRKNQKTKCTFAYEMNRKKSSKQA